MPQQPAGIGFEVRCGAPIAEGLQGGVGVGPQAQLNGRESESMRFHGTYVVTCESLRIVSDG